MLLEDCALTLQTISRSSTIVGQLRQTLELILVLLDVTNDVGFGELLAWLAQIGYKRVGA